MLRGKVAAVYCPVCFIRTPMTRPALLPFACTVQQDKGGGVYRVPVSVKPAKFSSRDPGTGKVTISNLGTWRWSHTCVVCGFDAAAWRHERDGPTNHSPHRQHSTTTLTHTHQHQARSC